MLVLGVAALAAGVVAMLRPAKPPLRPIRLTAGPLDTSRAMVAGMLVRAVESNGGEATLVETSGTEEMLKQVDHGTIDLGLVSEAYRIERAGHVRQVAPLYVEAMHLVVKQDLGSAVRESLRALGGRRIMLGPRRSTTTDLAMAVLRFAGLHPAGPAAPDGYVVEHATPEEITAQLAQHDPAALPDAFMFLATVPSMLAARLVPLGYRLVPLPFAEAFRLNALLADDDRQTFGDIEREHVIDTVIPAFMYQIEPAVPEAPLPTLGARLVLVAHDGVPPATVQHVLDSVFGSRVARIAHPPLDRGVLDAPPRLAMHEGTRQYLQRDRPYITPDLIDELGNSLSVIGALAGGLLFLWQWWRQQRREKEEETFGTYMLRIADLERQVATLELAATLELEPLIGLQRRVLELKSEALDRFASGELGNQGGLADLLASLNAARDHIGDLILHVRDNLEERAEVEGKAVTALWTDARAKGETSAG